MSPAKMLLVENATGDTTLEIKGMGAILSMWEWGHIISSILAGSVVLPLQQHPDYWKHHQYLHQHALDSSILIRNNNQNDYEYQGVEQESLSINPLYHLLEARPFVLASWIGALLCLWSLFLSNAFLSEPLPQFRFRDPGHIPRDIFTRLRSMLSAIPEDMDDDMSSLLSERANSGYGSIPFRQQTSSFSSSLPPSPLLQKTSAIPSSQQHNMKPSDNQNQNRPSKNSFVESQASDMDDAIRMSELAYAEDTALLSTTHARAVLVHFTDSQRHSDVLPLSDFEQGVDEKTRIGHREKNGDVLALSGDTTISSSGLWQNLNTRNHMIVYW